MQTNLNKEGKTKLLFFLCLSWILRDSQNTGENLKKNHLTTIYSWQNGYKSNCNIRENLTKKNSCILPIFNITVNQDKSEYGWS